VIKQLGKDSASVRSSSIDLLAGLLHQLTKQSSTSADKHIHKNSYDLYDYFCTPYTTHYITQSIFKVAKRKNKNL